MWKTRENVGVLSKLNFWKKILTFRIVCLDINLACFTFQVVKWDFGDYVPTLLSIILHLTFQGRNLVLPGVNKYWPALVCCCCLTWAWILPSSVTTQWVEELVGQHRKLITINVVKAQKAKLGLKPIFRPHAIDFVDFDSMFWSSSTLLRWRQWPREHKAEQQLQQLAQ